MYAPLETLHNVIYSVTENLPALAPGRDWQFSSLPALVL